MERKARLQGLQDKRLEANPRRNMDPEVLRNLVGNAAFASMALEGMSDGRGTPEMIKAQTTLIRGSRREAVIAGINLSVFDELVRDEVAIQKAKAEEERLKALEKEGDYKVLRREFPGIFPESEVDWERQAFTGEVPPVREPINWGNHAKKDPFGL